MASPGGSRSSAFQTALSALILGLITLALFGSFLSPATTKVLSLESGNLPGQFLWWRQFGFGELAKGHLALWNPRLFCGEAFFGGFQSALLYPPNWLFMVLPLPFAVNVSIALHVFLAGFFTYLWLTGRGALFSSRVLGAFLYMMGGAFFLHLIPGHLPNLCTMAWIPLIFMALDRQRENPSWRWVLLGSGALAMEILAGHIQIVYYTLLVAGLYALLSLWGCKNKIYYFLGFFLVGLGAALLTAVQWIAGAGAALESTRGLSLPIEFANMGSMTPGDVGGLLTPGFFGSWDRFWGGGLYWEGALFMSVTGLVLALFGLWKSRHPQKWLLLGLSILLIFVAVGKRSFLYTLCFQIVPYFGNFRGPGKINIFITLFLAALAALGMDEAIKNPRGLGRLTGILGSMILLFALLVKVGPPLSGGRFLSHFAGHTEDMMESLLTCAVLLGILSLIAWAAYRVKFFRYVFLVVAFVELFVFARNNMPTFDMLAQKNIVAQVQSIYDREPGDYRVWVQGSNYCLGTTGLDVWGEDPAFPSRYASFMALTQNNPDPGGLILREFIHDPNRLALLRLRYLVTLGDGGCKIQPTWLKEAPRIFLTDQWKVVSQSEALRQAAEPGFDPTQGILLESDPGTPFSLEKLEGNFELKDLSTDQIEISVRLNKAAVLVLTDNYSKGWKVTNLKPLSSASYAVLPANGFQRAIPLPAGTHHFLLEYRPLGFLFGCWVSLISWALFLPACFWAVRRKAA